MRKPDDQDKDRFIVMYYDKEMKIDLMAFKRNTDVQFECGWMKEKEVTLILGIED